MHRSLSSFWARTQPKKRTAARMRLRLEGLEDRTVPSITFSGPGNSGMAAITGTPGPDVFVIQLKPGDATTVELSDDGGQHFTDATLSGITGIEVDGLGGADRLRLNEGNGLVATPSGLPITFNGGHGYNVLGVRGDPGVSVSETLSAGDGPYESTLAMTDGASSATIALHHINHIFDISKADSLTVNAGNHNNFIHIGFGLVPIEGVTTNTIRGLDFSRIDDNGGQEDPGDMVGDGSDAAGGNNDDNHGENNPFELQLSRAFTPITYANKTNVTVNGLGGDDFFLVNVHHAATGEQSLTLDGGAGFNVAAIRHFPDNITLTLENINRTVNDPGSIFIHELYESALGRPTEDAALAGWVQFLNTQGPAAVVSAIETSTEARLDLVRQLYVHYLGRMPGDGEAMGWVTALSNGMAEEQVISDFLASDEFAQRAQQMFSASSGIQSFVQGLFQVALNRAPSDIELTGWTLGVALLGRATAANSFVGAPEFRLNTISALYTTVLHRLPDAAGLNGWLASGLSFHDIRLAILGSAEAMANG